MADKIAGAIAAAEAPAAEPRFRAALTLASGRVVGLEVPVSISAAEALDLIGYITGQLRADIAKAQRPGPQLLVPTGVRIAKA